MATIDPPGSVAGLRLRGQPRQGSGPNRGDVLPFNDGEPWNQHEHLEALKVYSWERWRTQFRHSGKALLQKPRKSTDRYIGIPVGPHDRRNLQLPSPDSVAASLRIGTEALH